jgi:hypothetical protein
MPSSFWNPRLKEAANRHGLCEADFLRLKHELAHDPMIGKPHPLVPMMRRHEFLPKIDRHLRLAAHYVIAPVTVFAPDQARGSLRFAPFISNVEDVGQSDFFRTDKEFVDTLNDRVEKILGLALVDIYA